jgi:type IV pilus assembly protein PilM
MSLATMFRTPTIGVDIGSSGVKAIALRQTRRGWTLIGTAEARIGSEPGTSDADPVEVGGAVRDALEALRLPRAPVAAALSGHVIVKRLSLPAMTEVELAQAISWEAEQCIPFDLADVQLDYQVISPRTGPSTTTQDVLLVAARKDRVEDRVALITHADRRAVVLDVAALALANAYEMNYPERTDALAALIHVGRETTIVCLLERGEVASTRDISMGARVVREATKQLVLEIRRTIDFFRGATPGADLERVVLSGGACTAEGLANLLATEFAATVEVFDPFRRIARRKNTGGGEGLGAAYALAVGLAMRREGDR